MHDAAPNNTPYTPKNMLVTGSAGFIGSHFVPIALERHPALHIISLDKLTYAGDRKHLEHLPDPARHTFIQGDIADADCVHQLLHHYQIDTIVHFAAESHVDRSITTPRAFVDTNVVGTFTLLEAARTYWLTEQKWDETACRFHHISTDEVYGSLNSTDAAFTEEHRYQPNSPYSASKAASDHLIRAYLHTYGLPVTLSNCSNNYGPHQHAEKLIPTIIRACLNKTDIPIYGNGQNVRDWLYVTDHCEAVDDIVCLAKPGETYHIGGNTEKNNLDVAIEICAQMDRLIPWHQPYASLLRYVTDRLGHDWRYAMNINKIQQDLQWRPRVSFERGLANTIAYYVTQCSFASNTNTPQPTEITT